MWRTDLLLDSIQTALAEREASLQSEHAVYGLDALSETRLHPILAGALAAAGWGVLREQPYPHEWRGRPVSTAASSPDPDLPLPRDRHRCDLVLTPSADQFLFDPLKTERTLRLHRREAQATLFEAVAEQDAPTIARVAESGVPPEDVFWLEVKVISQHTASGGAPGPNGAYSSQLSRSASDLEKLDQDQRIQHCGLCLLLFTASESIASRDLHTLAHRCLDCGMPLSAVESRSIAIQDRMGNHSLTIGLLSLRKNRL